MNGAQLRREVSVWEAIGISLALMAPSMAVNINPQGTAGAVGRAVPLAFALATVGVLLIGYTFVRLCQRFHHAGSVYGFVGATLGPRLGVVAGWALLGTYVLYGVVTSTAAGIFGATFLDSFGIWTHQPPWAGLSDRRRRADRGVLVSDRICSGGDQNPAVDRDRHRRADFSRGGGNPCPARVRHRAAGPHS